MVIGRCTATHDNFTSLINLITILDIDNLKIEYYIFAISLVKLYNGMNLNQTCANDISTESDDDFNS